MGRQEKLDNSLIDRFYNEESNSSLIASIDETELQHFESSMALLSENMNILVDQEPELDISIMNIIVKAENIKEKRKTVAENIIFVVLGLMILSSIGLLSFVIGVKFIIIFQAVAFALFPFSLIPLSKAVLSARRYEQ
jgi:hypothetical protein